MAITDQQAVAVGYLDMPLTVAVAHHDLGDRASLVPGGRIGLLDESHLAGLGHVSRENFDDRWRRAVARRQDHLAHPATTGAGCRGSRLGGAA